MRVPRLRLIAALIALVLALAGGWIWLRDSPLVSVERVTVTGAAGPQGPQIRAALQAAGHAMTTLDVNMGALRTAVAPYPVVKRLEVATGFPHGLRIRVIERPPVALIATPGARIAVAGDGTLLREMPAGKVPTIAVRALPGASRVTNPQALSVLAVLAAAPSQLLGHVGAASETAAHGVVIQLRDGPNVFFGDPSQAAAKWTAATAVLDDSGSAGAAYIDVSDPGRPAAGG